MASAPDNLSQENLIHLLHLRFNNNLKIQYHNYEFHSLTEDLNGFAGDHYVLKVTYSEADDADTVHTANYFVKTEPTKNKTQIDLAESLNVYVKEIFMNNTVLQEYGQREYDINFAPKMYLCKKSLTMVLEDLKVRDFKLYGSTKFYGVSEMQACLKSLAKFHAVSFVYEEDMSKERGTVYRLDQHYPTELKECLFTFEDGYSKALRDNNITMTSLPGNLSQEDLIHLLHLRFNNNLKIQYHNYEFHSLTEDLNGFAGDHYVLKITYTEADDADTVHTANYFVKTKPTKNKTQIDLAESLNVYVKEIFMYNTLLQEYGQREYDINFAPKMYLCKKGMTMVLEDLKVRDFKLYGRTKFYGVSEMQACLKSLAKFHAASFVYEEDMSKELGTVYRLDQHYPTELKECLFTFEDETTTGSIVYRTSIKCFLDLIDLFQEDEAWKMEFKKNLQEMDLIKLYTLDLKSRKACGHGDLWSNNMMFRYEDGQAVECVLLDYQIIRYFQPALDVLLAIYNNTRVSLRKNHLGEFIDCYYKCLKETVEEHGYSIKEIYSRSSFEEDMQTLTVGALLQVAAYHSVLFLDMDVVKKAVSGEEDGFKDLLFDEKTTTKKDAFMFDPQFKAVIEEDLYELHRSLVKY